MLAAEGINKKNDYPARTYPTVEKRGNGCATTLKCTFFAITLLCVGGALASHFTNFGGVNAIIGFSTGAAVSFIAFVIVVCQKRKESRRFPAPKKEGSNFQECNQTFNKQTDHVFSSSQNPSAHSKAPNSTSSKQGGPAKVNLKDAQKAISKISFTQADAKQEKTNAKCDRTVYLYLKGLFESFETKYINFDQLILEVNKLVKDCNNEQCCLIGKKIFLLADKIEYRKLGVKILQAIHWRVGTNVTYVQKYSYFHTLEPEKLVGYYVFSPSHEREKIDNNAISHAIEDYCISCHKCLIGKDLIAERAQLVTKLNRLFSNVENEDEVCYLFTIISTVSSLKKPLLLDTFAKINLPIEIDIGKVMSFALAHSIIFKEDTDEWDHPIFTIDMSDLIDEKYSPEGNAHGIICWAIIECLLTCSENCKFDDKRCSFIFANLTSTSYALLKEQLVYVRNDNIKKLEFINMLGEQTFSDEDEGILASLMKENKRLNTLVFPTDNMSQQVVNRVTQEHEKIIESRRITL